MSIAHHSHQTFARDTVDEGPRELSAGGRLGAACLLPSLDCCASSLASNDSRRAAARDWRATPAKAEAAAAASLFWLRRRVRPAPATFAGELLLTGGLLEAGVSLVAGVLLVVGSRPKAFSQAN